jgi:TatD DNase family protein
MSVDAKTHVVSGSVDSHFHTLVMEERQLPATDILARCLAEGMAYGLDVGVTLADLDERLERLSQLDPIYLSVGVHPHNAGSVTFAEAEPTLRRGLAEQRVVALGEIGLDWYRNHGTPEQQRALFVSQIELANELGLPIIVHNRDADEDILDVFSSHPPARESVMHCFSGGPEHARGFLDLGFTISFGGNVTYKRSEEIREAASITPADRILVETDAPFLAPQAVRGRPNHPGFVGYTYEFLAELRGETPEGLARATRETFERIFLSSDPAR